MIKDINHYMTIRKVSKNLKMKIRRYLEHLHEEEKFGLQRGQNHLLKLSENLKVKKINKLFTIVSI